MSGANSIDLGAEERAAVNAELEAADVHKPGRKRKTRDRSQPQRVHDLSVLTKMYKNGDTHSEIAKALGISRQMVCHEVGILNEAWLSAIKDNLTAIKLREVQKCDHIESEAMDAWERSKGKITKTATKSGRVNKDGDKLPDEVTTTVEYVAGDPRFLAEARSAAAERRKILGCYAPEKVANTDSNGNDFDSLSFEQRRLRVIEILSSAAEREGTAGSREPHHSDSV